MSLPTIYTIVSVSIVSIASLIGVIALAITKRNLDKILFIMVSFSSGTLLGGAFFHLIPEAVEKEGAFSPTITMLILSGMAIFFFVDKIIHWNHHHNNPTLAHTKETRSPVMAYLNLIGDGMHNFLDGLVIAGSYMVSIPTGIATSLAVIIHEIPQELADFGVLVFAGLSKKKALLFNFLSACVSFLGVGVAFLLADKTDMFVQITLPLTAGAFIYISGYNIIPELIEKNKRVESLVAPLLSMLLGILMMYGLLFLE
jgi:zinc and cadmium transporter